MIIFLRVFLLFCLFVFYSYGAERHFDIYKKSGQTEGDTLLVVGGIHGDEPGGYFAPVLLIKHYKVKKGSIWIIPNTNFDSLLLGRRGIYGDMNRKFAEIDKNDRDRKIIEDLKNIITHEDVNFVANLHDGRGFYRHNWESAIFNPKAWGQAYIIDQRNIDDIKYGNVDEITKTISENLNRKLNANYHSFSVKNTKTKDKDEAMQKSLTYFAITHLKPAIAIETSKNIEELNQKVFYQLKSIEELLKIMEIEFERDFELTLENVEKLLYDFGDLKINKNLSLPLNNLRATLRFVPMKKEGNSFEIDHPLGDVSWQGDHFRVNIGNIIISRLYPQYFEQNCKNRSAKFVIDKEEREVSFGDIVEVSNSFKVIKEDHFRVNVIGFITKADSQDGFEIDRKSILPRFSIDNDNSIFRVEFYDNGSFCGMVGVKFI